LQNRSHQQQINPEKYPSQHKNKIKQTTKAFTSWTAYDESLLKKELAAGAWKAMECTHKKEAKQAHRQHLRLLGVQDMSEDDEDQPAEI
jgi:adenine-specific DNA glycosylase